MATQTRLPDWLDAAIAKYSLVNADNNREIFEVYFDESNTVDSPRFRKLCERLVRLKKVKKRFVTSLESNGYFDDDADLEADADEEEDAEDAAEFEDDEEEFEDSDDAEFEDDEDYEDDEDSLDADEDAEDEEELEDDEDTDLELEDDEEEEEETAEVEEEVEEETPEPTTTKRKPGRPRTKPVSQYEDTGVPTLDEVTALIGDTYTHTEEFEDPTHLRIAATALSDLGFTTEYDARVRGGTIKRPRGGKFVLRISVTEKRAVKRRGKQAPVFAFTQQIINEFDEQADNIIADLIEQYTTTEDGE